VERLLGAALGDYPVSVAASLDALATACFVCLAHTSGNAAPAVAVLRAFGTPLTVQHHTNSLCFFAHHHKTQPSSEPLVLLFRLALAVLREIAAVAVHASRVLSDMLSRATAARSSLGNSTISPGKITRKIKETSVRYRGQL
jgi:hypothetical protein